MPLEAVRSRRWGKAHWNPWGALEEQNLDDIKCLVFQIICYKDSVSLKSVWDGGAAIMLTN